MLASAAVTRCASVVSRFARASTESATCFSARPPISATMRARSCRSVSKAFMVWSVIGVIFQSSLAEAAGDVVLRTPVIRIGENSGRFAEFHELAEIHERGEIGHPRGLLHVVRHDRDRVVVLELVDELLDLGG